MEKLKPPENTSPLKNKTQSPHLTKSLVHPLQMKSLYL